MIIAKLKGGLGNQMFQYALGRVLSIKNNATLAFDVSFYNASPNPKREYDLPVFNIVGEILDDRAIPLLYRESKNKLLNNFFKLIRKLFLKHRGSERSFSFDEKALSLGPNAYLDGYWQSPKYFTDFENVIRKDFTLKNPPASNIQNLANEILSLNAICIHVRRGDYVGNKYHEVVNNDYYKTGLEKIYGMTAIEKIYIFSDDIGWCKENLSFGMSAMFVGDEYAGIKGEGHMYLMSCCKNFIIANSSFSWWAAWLSNYEKKIVICPRQWFGDASINTSDLIPEGWIPLEII